MENFSIKEYWKKFYNQTELNFGFVQNFILNNSFDSYVF